jgi:hypothetical protein
VTDQQQSDNLKIIEALMLGRSLSDLERCNCQSWVGIKLRGMSMMVRLAAGGSYPHKLVAHSTLLPTSPDFIYSRKTLRS